MNESGISGRNNIKNTIKIIANTTAKIKTEGISITMTTANITTAKYAARYPPMPVTCLPFMVIVVPEKKLITDNNSNMPSIINSIFLFIIHIANELSCPVVIDPKSSGDAPFYLPHMPFSAYPLHH